MTIHFARWAVARRPALVGLAFPTALVGGFAVVRAAQNVWAVDAHRNLAAAVALQHGAFGSDPDYLYSPLAAALTVPAVALPTDVAVVAWLALKIALLVVGTAIATRELGRIDRLLLGVAVVAFLPILYDLELGNVTVLIAAAIATVAWIPDRASAGIPLGIILATAPKPQLIPVLIWMALFRRRALAGALGAAGVGTLAGFVVVGPGPYEAWIAALRAPPDLTRGNLSLSGMPTLVAIPAALAVVAGTILALRRGPAPGLVAALACGLLVSPYTILYGAGVLLVATPCLARAAPRGTLALALLAPVGLVVAFPLWVASVGLLAFAVPSEPWPGGAPLGVSVAPPPARVAS